VSEYAAFAGALEKRASSSLSESKQPSEKDILASLDAILAHAKARKAGVPTPALPSGVTFGKTASSSLEDAYVRQKAKGEVEDLKRSKSRMAYPAGVAAGAVGGAAIPTLLGLSHYLGDQQARGAELASRVQEAEMYHLVKSLPDSGPPMKDGGARAAASDIHRWIRSEQTPASASVVGPRVRRDALLRAAVAAEGKYPPALLTDVRHAFPTGAVAGSAEEVPVLQYIIDHLLDKPAPGHVGPAEISNLRAQATKAAAGKVSEKAISREMLKEFVSGSARGAIPLAVIGAIGGALAVRSKRKQLKELEDARR